MIYYFLKNNAKLYFTHTQINNLTKYIKLFSVYFRCIIFAENSSTGREDKQTKCNNAEHTFATAG